MFLPLNDRISNLRNVNVLIASVWFLLTTGCTKEELPEENKPSPLPTTGEVYNPTTYELDYPSYFPHMSIPKYNPMTVEGVVLGRRLYYDPLLSKNGPKNGLSCSSCHSQSSAFTINHSGTAVLAHINLGWNNFFLWEGKVVGEVEDIMRFEVEEFFQTDVDVLQRDPTYPSLFFKAFGTKVITKEHTEYALAQFFRTLKSTDSKYDRFLRKEEAFNYSEFNGYKIFFSEKGDCFHCHSATLLTDNRFHNIGLDEEFTVNNAGRSNVTGNEKDLGHFKTPTLRNIELTGPYMHDGRFTTLEEVIDHYNSGVKYSPSLDPIMTKSGKEFGLQLSDQEKSDLVAFLKTLTDQRFITDTTLSNPF